MKDTYIYAVKRVAQVTVNNARQANHLDSKTISTTVQMSCIVGSAAAIQACPLTTPSFQTDNLI
jgi:hypothetical protein